jgi:hypothetical protein
VLPTPFNDDGPPQAVMLPSDPAAAFAPAAVGEVPEVSSVVAWLGLAAIGAYGARKRLRRV